MAEHAGVQHAQIDTDSISDDTYDDAMQQPHNFSESTKEDDVSSKNQLSQIDSEHQYYFNADQASILG